MWTSWVGLCKINRNIPTTWRWARGHVRPRRSDSGKHLKSVAPSSIWSDDMCDQRQLRWRPSSLAAGKKAGRRRQHWSPELERRCSCECQEEKLGPHADHESKWDYLHVQPLAEGRVGLLAVRLLRLPSFLPSYSSSSSHKRRAKR